MATKVKIHKTRSRDFGMWGMSGVTNESKHYVTVTMISIVGYFCVKLNK